MPMTPGDIPWQRFHIHGTGFVVEHTPKILKVLTNRHVIRSLREAEQDERCWASVFHSSLLNEQGTSSMGLLIGWSSTDEFEGFVFPGYQDGVSDFAFMTRDVTKILTALRPNEHPPVPFAKGFDRHHSGSRPQRWAGLQ